MRIETVTDIDRVWAEAKPLLQKAVDQSAGELAIHDVYKLLIDGVYRLVIVTEDDDLIAAVVLDKVDYPQKIAVRYMLLGGRNMHDWIPAMDQYVSDWAVQNGIDCLEIIGRRGWVKPLKDYGYEPEYVHLIKDLRHG